MPANPRRRRAPTTEYLTSASERSSNFRIWRKSVTDDVPRRQSSALQERFEAVLPSGVPPRQRRSVFDQVAHCPSDPFLIHRPGHVVVRAEDVEVFASQAFEHELDDLFGRPSAGRLLRDPRRDEASVGAPAAPPTRLIAAIVLNDSCPVPSTARRPDQPEATCPGNRATVDVMFANLGSRPLKIRAGRVRKDPPPAMAFCPPAHMAARKITRNSSGIRPFRWAAHCASRRAAVSTRSGD